jgi:O-antigen ligase
MKHREIGSMNTLPLHMRIASLLMAGLGLSLFTTVAGTNIMVLLLLLTTPWAWRGFKFEDAEKTQTLRFLGLIVAICLWDLACNLIAGHVWLDATKAMVHDMRTFGFIVLLWPVFSNVVFARRAIWALFGMVVVLATVNLLLVLLGYLPPGKYFWPTAPHMYGQTLVGLIFLLAQMQLVRPKFSWLIALPMLLLVASLFLASERRTGYLQLAAGFVVWIALNYKRLLVGKYKWWIALGAVGVLLIAVLSPVVQSRMDAAFLEVNQYLGQTTIERANNATSVGIRMQFYVSALAVVVQHLWIGVGSIDFPVLFQKMNAGMGGVTNLSVFTNPHNEYIYILATKGIVGLVLYLAIFIQACRMAWRKTDEVQRIGLLMFIFLFMLSITTNSMMIDMEEGHFTMLILLIFLAPKSLDLVNATAPSTPSSPAAPSY